MLEMLSNLLKRIVYGNRSPHHTYSTLAEFIKTKPDIRISGEYVIASIHNVTYYPGSPGVLYNGKNNIPEVRVSQDIPESRIPELRDHTLSRVDLRLYKDRIIEITDFKIEPKKDTLEARANTSELATA